MIRGGNLHIYEVFLKREGSKLIDSLRFVRLGFDPFAFIFGILWALSNQLWFAALLQIAITVAIVLGVDHFDLATSTRYVLELGLHVWFGFAGPEFLSRSLKRRGYLSYDVVSGENTIRAEQRFLDRHTELHGIAV